MKRIVYDTDTAYLREGERLDDLCWRDLKLIQHPDSYCFTCDAVELAGFVSGGVKDRAAELGAGTGVISILLAAKKQMRVDAVELQESLADMTARSVALNGLNDRIRVYHGRMQEAHGVVGGDYDVVVCNPPYFKADTGKRQSNLIVRRARHETDVTFVEVADAAVRLLKFGGRFYCINTATRLAEVIAVSKTRRLEPKVLQFLTPKKEEPPHLFMLKCTYGGSEGLSVLRVRAIEEQPEHG